LIRAGRLRDVGVHRRGGFLFGLKLVSLFVSGLVCIGCAVFARRIIAVGCLLTH
jgi:hypothetical protein